MLGKAPDDRFSKRYSYWRSITDEIDIIALKVQFEVVRQKLKYFSILLPCPE